MLGKFFKVQQYRDSSMLWVELIMLGKRALLCRRVDHGVASSLRRHIYDHDPSYTLVFDPSTPELDFWSSLDAELEAGGTAAVAALEMWESQQQQLNTIREHARHNPTDVEHGFFSDIGRDDSAPSSDGSTDSDHSSDIPDSDANGEGIHERRGCSESLPSVTLNTRRFRCRAAARRPMPPITPHDLEMRDHRPQQLPTPFLEGISTPPHDR